VAPVDDPGSGAPGPDRLTRSAAVPTEKLNTRAAGIVGLAVLCSRVLGVAREQIFAALFGGGRLMDAFTIAFRTPNLLRDLFAEGALSTAFVTTFSKTIAVEGEPAAWALANKVTTLAAVTLSAITAVGILIAPWLVAILAPGFDPEKAALTVTLARVMYPFILLVSLAALVMGMLNARNVFGVPVMASSFFNLGSIVGGVSVGWWIDPHFGQKALLGLAVGTLIGGALQLLVQLPSLRRLGYAFRPDFQWKDRGVATILQLMGPSVIAASSTQVNVMVNSIFASQLGDGPTFWLSIAFRLMQLPLGVFGVALGMVSLPLLARMAATGNLGGFRTELSRGIRLAFLLTLPAAVGLMMLAEPIISVLYQHGKFGAHETQQAAAALRFYALGLCGYAALKVLVNAFYALDKRKTPMVVSFGAIALNLGLSWLFTFRLGLGHRGLALSTAVLATVNFLVLFLLMRRNLARFETRALVATLLKALIACAALAAVCWAGMHWLMAEWPVQRFVPKLACLLATIVVAGGLFVGVASLLRIPELDEITGAVMRRLRKRKART
jgi:putative peptidoglycan lipid II flippase